MKIYGFKTFLLSLLGIISIFMLFDKFVDGLIFVVTAIFILLLFLFKIIVVKPKTNVINIISIFSLLKGTSIGIEHLGKVNISDGGMAQALTTIRFLDKKSVLIKSIFTMMYHFERKSFASFLESKSIEVDGNGI